MTSNYININLTDGISPLNRWHGAKTAMVERSEPAHFERFLNSWDLSGLPRSVLIVCKNLNRDIQPLSNACTMVLAR